MRRAIFAMLVACGSPAPVQSVEIAQPLPSVTASASASSTPVAMSVAPQPSEDVDLRDLRNPPRSPRLVHNEASVLERELARDFSQARRAYYDLIKTAPSSRFVPYAYYAFGEMFAAEAKSDPTRWALAEQAYVETVKYQTSPIAKGHARRAAEVRARAHDCGGA